VEGQVNKNEIIVILDGYAELSLDVVNQYKGISVIDLGSNRGMQYAINVGVWNSSSEKILIVNDDNVFPPEWDTRIEEQYHPNTILTVNQIEPTGPGMFHFPVVDCGKTIETFDMEAFVKVEKELSHNRLSLDGNIFPFLINKRWFMAVGGFDTYYDSPNLCDWDFFAKLELIPTIGYARTHNVHLYHFGSVATKKNSESIKFREREAFAAQQYEYKWKFNPYNGVNNSKIPTGRYNKGE
jgi:glycosyltransferase involved in cell wall biosynthesis